MFWNALDDEGLLASAALKIMLLTGQRKIEVLNLRREHIRDGFWELPGKAVPELNWPGTKTASRTGYGLPSRC